ncbi:polysaccharide biosynthesis/export family protein [Lacipirellula limnantheis]|uniref:Polysaccharide biosynthesis/export protein n=1 Tax=Lacipirellula limnantheis TaxID=2528024 RepID=A0A517TSL1_9BACT|nr:polysaccharide biosynthesis/export family protein [Lacipirellula limnantheis]QDT71367.1 Polysaccharide biosynthesis/export protein [Lacipirellula limnantheis]
MNRRWERTALRKWSLFAVAAATVASLASVVASQRPKTFDGRPKPPVQAANSDEIQLCQALGPAAPYPVWGVDSTVGAGRGEVTWDARGPVDWQAYAQGEYVGHARLAHVPEYRIRVDDRIIFVFRLTREMTSFPYELQVGDKIRVESLTGDSAAGGIGGTQDDVRRELVVQPDGTITLPLLGQVRAANMTVDGLRAHLEERYKKYYKVPAITVTPVEVNTRLQDLINAVVARQGNGGQQLESTVNPDGRLFLPGLGPICAQGLTVDELKLEVDARYDAAIPGVDITPVITQRATRYVFIGGEVRQPNRYTLEGPTTLMAAIQMAGGHLNGANLRQVVVFRRGDDWRLLASMFDVQGGIYGKRPTPADEIWLNDSDIVIVPKTPIRVADEWISEFFTNGLYAMFPQFAFGNLNFNNFRSISN